MPRRRTVLANREIYHVLNRGISSAPIFNYPKEYDRFYELLKYYVYDPLISFSAISRISPDIRRDLVVSFQKEENRLVNIFSDCLMSNHYHILLEQLKDDGIKRYISNIQNAYVKYFNIKHKRKGPLFESAFSSIRIENDSQFLHVSRYIHLNPNTAYIVEPESLENYKWSSYCSYLKEDNKQKFINTEKIISIIGSRKKYISFIQDHADYQKQLGKIKHLVLEK